STRSEQFPGDYPTHVRPRPGSDYPCRPLLDPALSDGPPDPYSLQPISTIHPSLTQSIPCLPRLPGPVGSSSHPLDCPRFSVPSRANRRANPISFRFRPIRLSHSRLTDPSRQTSPPPPRSIPSLSDNPALPVSSQFIPLRQTNPAQPTHRPRPT